MTIAPYAADFRGRGRGTPDRAPAGAPIDEPAIDGASDALAPAIRWRKVLLLVAVLPFFGQTFAYIGDLKLLWALAKAFPLLTLPLILLLVPQGQPLIGRQMLFTVLWLLLVPSFIAIETFNQDFFTGLTAQVKMLPLLFFFSFLGLLCWLRPTLDEIARAFLICGVATMVVLVLLWALVPQAWYDIKYVIGHAPLFSADNRGNRIRMPMYFALVSLFYFYRTFVATRRKGWLALVAAVFGMILGIVRLRAMVVAVVGVLAINSAVIARPWQRIAVAVIVPLAVLALFQIPYVASMFDTSADAGFDVRRVSAGIAIDFIGTNPLAWLFGVGSISSLDPAGMIHYFNHFFFLADITWLGIIFEFGLFGAALLVLLAVRGLVLAQAMRRGGDTPFLGAIQDFLLYTLMISSLNPMTLAPGEYATLLAVLVYVRAVRDTPAPAQA